MQKSQRVFSQIGRTVLKQQRQSQPQTLRQSQQQFNLHAEQQQQQLHSALLALAASQCPPVAAAAEAAAAPLHLPPNYSHIKPTAKVLQIPARTYSKFTAAREPPIPLGSQPLCEERALDLISNLKETELAAIKVALRKYDAMKQKESFEGKLAATQWRTRFGRLSKVPALGEVDPTGSFCAFPDDWLKKKAVEQAANPSRSDLWKIFFVNAVPFVGFGFLDNFTMIIAGDYIEYIFGTFMCISTMAAAGLGNTISDVLGIGSAYYVERGCEFLGLKPPDLTPIQMEMKSSRRAANNGRIIGITVGCLIGMVPLLFMDRKTDKDHKEDEDEDKTKTEHKAKEAEPLPAIAQ